VPTIGISIVRRFTEEVKAPRSVFLKWPMGHPLGEPGRVDEHRIVLKAAFKALADITTPGAIIDLPYRWKRPGDLTRGI
jgi:D-proline reductase (dithiol) PrdB